MIKKKKVFSFHLLFSLLLVNFAFHPESLRYRWLRMTLVGMPFFLRTPIQIEECHVYIHEEEEEAILYTGVGSFVYKWFPWLLLLLLLRLCSARLVAVSKISHPDEKSSSSSSLLFVFCFWLSLLFPPLCSSFPRQTLISFSLLRAPPLLGYSWNATPPSSVWPSCVYNGD
jgi:hypothetical protein